ncbi:MAG TPA: hypothetical protein VHB77_04915, partial [Planctomycetaceae bacterium]|nr:hypothetical protein [Planctomycetaceae bacterium]
HAFVQKHLPTILRREVPSSNKRRAARRAVMTHLRHLAKEVEVLSPTCDSVDRPDNCEYPWQIADKVLSPLDWTFVPLQLLMAPSGVTFLKAVRTAINRMLQEARASS